MFFRIQTEKCDCEKEVYANAEIKKKNTEYYDNYGGVNM